MYHVNEDSIRFVLRAYYVLQVPTTSLLRWYCVLISPRPHYVCFEHVQSSTKSSTSIKTSLRPMRFPLRSYHVLQVLTSSSNFFRTKCERSGNVAWCDWGISSAAYMMDNLICCDTLISDNPIRTTYRHGACQ